MPEHLRKSLTVDNGSGFAYSELIILEKKFPGFQVYFCDPYSAWQKGSVENSNRDLRWYFPKGTDFSKVARVELARVEARLAARPLKCLGYRTSAEFVADREKQIEVEQKAA